MLQSGTFTNKYCGVMRVVDGKKDEQRVFWTKTSKKDEDYLGGSCKARHPVLSGQDCAYGDPRDKPPEKTGWGHCPYSRENENK
ncbi:MAG: hypothetical protein L7H18_00330 [Candidatus Nealsonbacteria bacterium DGGOD1a]|nr:MAG: hypothetical protein L7H18_00330 [Candidatus Nealsonbacteria bacterium DGGOD1a]